MHGGPTKQYLRFKTDLNIQARKILSHFESHFQRLIHQFGPWKKSHTEVESLLTFLQQSDFHFSIPVETSTQVFTLLNETT